MARSSPPRILLVEDDTAIRELTEDALNSFGYEVTAVADAETALETLASAASFDLLISDVRLPGMNGRDLARHALAGHARLRVLLITGYAGTHGTDPAFLPPDIRLLKKPFTLRELLGSIHSTL